jgi:hypothetical protein
MEDVMATFPETNNRFSYEGYLADMGRNDPGLIIVNAEMTPDLIRAIQTYLTNAPKKSFIPLRIGNVPIYLRAPNSDHTQSLKN